MQTRCSMNYHNGDIFHSNVISNVDNFHFCIKQELVINFSQDRKEYTNYPPQFRQDGIKFLLLSRGGRGWRSNLACDMHSQRTPELSLVLEPPRLDVDNEDNTTSVLRCWYFPGVECLLIPVWTPTNTKIAFWTYYLPPRLCNGLAFISQLQRRFLLLSKTCVRNSKHETASHQLFREPRASPRSQLRY